MNRRERTQLLALLLLIVTAGLIWYAVFTNQVGELTVSFLDVGQGDAIFIESTSGTQVLVDGGRGLASVRELSRAMPFFDRSIDLVVATHPDEDHIGGLVDVFERYQVTKYMHSGNERGAAAARVLARRAQEEKARIYVARAGQVVDIGGGAFIRVLYPDKDVSSLETNSASIILQLVYGETEVLLTGDAPQEIEQYVAHIYGELLDSEILKLGHHGSSDASARSFVALASPEYAVASAGCDNPYGHPHREVVELTQELGAELLSTCESGTITFTIDGTTIQQH